MASTRARLTVSYAFVLLCTMVAFGTAIYWERRSAVDNELGREAFRVADNVIFTMQTSGQRLTFIDSSSSEGPIVRGTKQLADLLDPVPGYFMVLDRQGRVLYSSGLMRLLSGDDQTLLLRSALRLPDETAGPLVHLVRFSRWQSAIRQVRTCASSARYRQICLCCRRSSC
jgi:hypothetical protein